jgi:rhodanese-related sulfurtransferase
MNANPLTPGDRSLPSGYAFRPELEVHPRHAKAQLDAGRVLLIDCRTREEWDAAHVPGSLHIPLDQFDRRLDDVEPMPGQQVLVMCHHGVRSLRATHVLRANGHPDAKSVAGGIDLWSLTCDPGVRRYERVAGVVRLA